MRAELLCRVRSDVTLTLPVKGEETILGLDRSLKASIPVPGVSRQHARILWDGKDYWLEDIKSTNGTFLNGQRVAREKLRHLDIISLGKRADALFMLRSDEAPAVVEKRGILHAALVAEGSDAGRNEIPRGEVTYGRSASCNVTTESGAVSKVHAKLERTPEQLVLQDLGSSNGTFVNGEKVMTAALQDGDLVSFGGVDNFRVSIEYGEVTSASGSLQVSVAPVATQPEERAPVSKEWKTRFDWDVEELRAIASLPKGLVQEATGMRRPDAAAKKAAPHAPAVAKPTPPRPAAPATPKAAAPPAAPKVAPPVVPTPAAPRAAPVAPAPVPPTAAAPPAAPAQAPPRVAPPPAVPIQALPKAAAPPPAPTAAPPPPVSAPAPSPPAETIFQARAPTPVVEVLLTGPDTEGAVAQSGAHDVGRSQEAVIRVHNPTVSRRHARIIISDDRMMVYIQDLGTMNGTWVNGKRIEGLEVLSDGDKVGVGEVLLAVSIKRS